MHFGGERGFDWLVSASASSLQVRILLTNISSSKDTGSPDGLHNVLDGGLLSLRLKVAMGFGMISCSLFKNLDCDESL